MTRGHRHAPALDLRQSILTARLAGRFGSRSPRACDEQEIRCWADASIESHPTRQDGESVYRPIDSVASVGEAISSLGAAIGFQNRTRYIGKTKPTQNSTAHNANWLQVAVSNRTKGRRGRAIDRDQSDYNGYAARIGYVACRQGVRLLIDRVLADRC